MAVRSGSATSCSGYIIGTPKRMKLLTTATIWPVSRRKTWLTLSISAQGEGEMMIRR